MTKQAQKSGEYSKNIQVGGDLYINQGYTYDQVKEVAIDLLGPENNKAVLSSDSLLTIKNIQNRIYIIRGVKIMLDKDLADLYGVDIRILNRNVRRNRERFPSDFLYELTKPEMLALQKIRGEIQEGRGGRRKLPFAFTEYGVSMLSTVLGSKKAIQINIDIMRAFTHFKFALMNDKYLSKRINELEGKFEAHDQKFKIVFDVMRELLVSSKKTKLFKS